MNLKHDKNRKIPSKQIKKRIEVRDLSNPLLLPDRQKPFHRRPRRARLVALEEDVPEPRDPLEHLLTLPTTGSGEDVPHLGSDGLVRSVDFSASSHGAVDGEACSEGRSGKGRGKREEGRGKREEGRGKREEGRG
jgi:hypothetical protein